MASVIGGMTVSLDGFVADDKGDSGRLYPDLEALRGTDYLAAMVAEAGAVLMGRGTFEMADDPDMYVGNYEYQVPIFVMTSHPPATMPKQDEHLTFTFVTDGVESGVAQARQAAGAKAVQVVGGPGLTTDLLVAGLVDELRVDVMPVFLGAGKRLFDDPALAGIELHKQGVLEIGQRTSLTFSVRPR